MQESKTLFGLSIEVIIAGGFIVFFSIIAGIYYQLWNNYARTEAAKESMAKYADMAAYDSTTVRGQDVISLITSSKGDPFVIVTNSSGRVLATSYDGYTGSYTIKADSLNSAMEASIASSLVDTNVSALTESGMQRWDWSSTSPASSTIQDFFLNGNGSSNPGYYSSYTTYLVYESDGSSNILGVIAQRN